MASYVFFFHRDTMSSSVHQAITGSRCDSLSDREVTGENVSVYMTPAPETPYETPNSTPRRIHCRLKPVKTIRQHVPLKINFSQDVDNSAVDQGKSLIDFNFVCELSRKRCPFGHFLSRIISRIGIRLPRVLHRRNTKYAPIPTKYQF